MNLKIKYILVFSLIVVSFYFTDRVMVYINNKNPIMKEIVLNKDKYKVEKTILIKLNKSETISNKEIGNINFESSSIEKPSAICAVHSECSATLCISPLFDMCAIYSEFTSIKSPF